MIVTADSLSNAPTEVTGPIIIGSGPIGIVLARALAERGVPSLVLEAGGEIRGNNVTQDLWTETTGYPLRGATIGRTRQLGGGANLWGGQLALLRGDEVNPTGDAPCGWPIEPGEVTSRYSTAARLLGQEIDFVIPPISELAEARKALADSDLELVATAWLRVPKLPRAVWEELASSSMVTIAHGALVDGLSVEPDGRVRAVAAITASGVRRTFSGTAVVLACGAIETSRLLLLPTADGNAAPWAGLEWLGRGFNEHLDATVATVRPKRRALLAELFDPVFYAGGKYSPKMLGAIDVGKGAPLHAVGMFTMPGNVRNALSEIKLLLKGLTPRSRGRAALPLLVASMAASREIMPLAWRYLRHRRLGTMIRGTGSFRVSVEQPVRYDSRILLATTRDRHGVPHAAIDWKKGREEGTVFLEMALRMKRWAETTGAAAVDLDPSLLDDPAAFAAAADDGLHHAGGARMARRASEGVVDADLAVFGATALYCCGAAVFPRMGYANPTLTAAALAVRLAELLARRAAV